MRSSNEENVKIAVNRYREELQKNRLTTKSVPNLHSTKFRSLLILELQPLRTWFTPPRLSIYVTEEVRLPVRILRKRT